MSSSSSSSRLSLKTLNHHLRNTIFIVAKNEIPNSTTTTSPSFCASYSISSRPLSTLSDDSPLESAVQPQGNERGRWLRWLLFLPGVSTFGLGTWQFFRRQDKIEMLEYRRNRLDLEPVTRNKTSSSGDVGSLEFRRVLCEGVFDETKSIYVGPRSRSISGVTENGYYVITPLMPRSRNSNSLQSPVLVNRGWVPRSWRDKARAEVQQSERSSNGVESSSNRVKEAASWWKFWSEKPEIVEEPVPAITPTRVIGVVRGSEKPSIFVPANDPISGQWFYVDVPAIARAAGLLEDTVYLEDINDNVNLSSPYPIPKDVNALNRSSVMPQDHLNYMITWYSLSAAVTFMAFKRLKQMKLKPKKIRR